MKVKLEILTHTYILIGEVNFTRADIVSSYCEKYPWIIKNRFNIGQTIIWTSTWLIDTETKKHWIYRYSSTPLLETLK